MPKIQAFVDFHNGKIDEEECDRQFYALKARQGRLRTICDLLATMLWLLRHRR